MPWSTPANDHYCIIVGWLQALAKKAFARKSVQPVNPLISEHTWDLMGQRNSIVKQRRLLHRTFCKHLCSKYFQSWCKYAMSSCFDTAVIHVLSSEAACNLRNLCFSMSYLCKCFNVLSKCIAKSIKSSRIETTEKLAVDAEVAASAHDSATLYRVVKMMSRRRNVRSTTVLAADGTVLSKREDIAARWQEFFAGKLAGKEMTFEALIGMSNQTTDRAINYMLCDGLDNDAIPTLHDLWRSFAYCKSGRSVGEDGLPSELLQLASQHLSRIFYPLELKSWVRCETPVYWRGGGVGEHLQGEGSERMLHEFPRRVR